MFFLLIKTKGPLKFKQINLIQRKNFRRERHEIFDTNIQRSWIEPIGQQRKIRKVFQLDKPV